MIGHMTGRYTSLTLHFDLDTMRRTFAPDSLTPEKAIRKYRLVEVTEAEKRKLHVKEQVSVVYKQKPKLHLKTSEGDRKKEDRQYFRYESGRCGTPTQRGNVLHLAKNTTSVEREPLLEMFDNERHTQYLIGERQDGGSAVLHIQCR